MAGVVLKVRFKDELHRLTLEKVITFSELEDILVEFFGPRLPTHSIKYTDEDDDMITISSDMELKEAIQYASNHNKLLRLSVFDIQQPQIHSGHPPSQSGDQNQHAAALNHVAIDLAKMMLSSMTTHNPTSPPPEQLSAFQPLIGQMLTQSVQEMLPHLISSLMPAVSAQMKPLPSSSAGIDKDNQSPSATNPFIAGVLGQPIPQNQKQQPQPPLRQATPSPPASVSELYPSLAPLFSSLGNSPSSQQPQPQQTQPVTTTPTTPATTAPLGRPVGTGPVPIPSPSTPPPQRAPESPPTPHYSTLSTSPLSQPAKGGGGTTPATPTTTTPATTAGSSYPPMPRGYVPINYAPISTTQSLPIMSSSGQKHEGARRLDSRCTISGAVNEEFGLGERFIRKWGWKNEGNVEWPAQCVMRFFTGEPFGFPSGGVVIPQPIKPTECVEISVELVAPRSEGTHIGQFGLCLPSGEPIGPPMWMQIRTVQKTGNLGGTPPPKGTEPAPHSASMHASDSRLMESLDQALKEMESMGLGDRTKNIEALLRHNGNLEMAVNELFQ